MNVTISKFDSKVGGWRLAGFLCVLVLNMVGCSSSSSSLHYYLLHSTSATHSVNSQANKTPALLTIDKLVIPEYLKQRGLVYQISETNIHISTTHLWAEPVEEGIVKVLRSALSSKGVKLLKQDDYARGSVPATNHRISILINDFVSTYGGEVILSGEYVITAADSEAMHQSFMFKAPINHDGFEASIKAMRATLNQLSEQIKETM
jgi:uncharacterized lipoprotein YmbA